MPVTVRYSLTACSGEPSTPCGAQVVAEELASKAACSAEARRLRLRVAELEAALGEDDAEFDSLHSAAPLASQARLPSCGVLALR